ncbi:MAG: OmpH family outer membrane protein [Thermoanaerobaculia bacterium]
MPRFIPIRRRSIAAVALFGAAVLAFPPAGRAQERPINIAVVNLDFVASKSKAGTKLRQDLDTFQKIVRAEVETRQQASAAIRQQISDGINSLTEARLNELRKQYEDAQIDLKYYQDDKQREGQEMQEAGLKAIEDEMAPVFEAIRAEEGYDLILNYVPGVVVMAGERVDITQKVVDRLNAPGS